MTQSLDVLIPTYRRTVALAVELTSLAAQTWPDFRIVVSDQSESDELSACGELQAVVRLLRVQGRPVEFHRHLPRRGMAEQRQFLLDQARARFALYLDDDLILEPDVLGRMLAAIGEEGCGLVGCGLIGLSYADDMRPEEQEVEFWTGRVEPERVRSGSPQWNRYRLHNAANLLHLQQRLGLTFYPRQGNAAAGQRKYRVAWIGGCTMYDAEKLRAAGGFEFWRQLPPDHCGEDVLAQLRVLARYGGCGLIPSGVYHQELPTTIGCRMHNAPVMLDT